MHLKKRAGIACAAIMIAISAGGCGEVMQDGVGQSKSSMASIETVSSRDAFSGLDKRAYLGGAGHVDCDGAGGFTPVVGDMPGQYPGCPGFYHCTLAHENSHIADYKTHYPSACQGKPAGHHAAWSVEINNWSECRAYTVSVNCLTNFHNLADKCKKVYGDILVIFQGRKQSYCG